MSDDVTLIGPDEAHGLLPLLPVFGLVMSASRMTGWRDLRHDHARDGWRWFSGADELDDQGNPGRGEVSNGQGTDDASWSCAIGERPVATPWLGAPDICLG